MSRVLCKRVDIRYALTDGFSKDRECCNSFVLTGSQWSKRNIIKHETCWKDISEATQINAAVICYDTKVTYNSLHAELWHHHCSMSVRVLVAKDVLI